MGRKKPEEFQELVIDGASCPKTNNCKKISPKLVKSYFVSKVCPFSNSGAYIPCSEDYVSQKVYVIVLKEKVI